MQYMDNPLLGEDSLPQFKRIRPEHVEPAVRELLSENRARIGKLATLDAPTFAPYSAARWAAASPPLPPPITTRSNFSVMTASSRHSPAPSHVIEDARYADTVG